MPLYEYVCEKCGAQFEELVRGGTVPRCPKCQAEELRRVLSVTAPSRTGESTSLPLAAGPCGSCGHPDGPGACRRG